MNRVADVVVFGGEDILPGHLALGVEEDGGAHVDGFSHSGRGLADGCYQHDRHLFGVDAVFLNHLGEVFGAEKSAVVEVGFEDKGQAFILNGLEEHIPVQCGVFGGNEGEFFLVGKANHSHRHGNRVVAINFHNTETGFQRHKVVGGGLLRGGHCVFSPFQTLEP